MLRGLSLLIVALWAGALWMTGLAAFLLFDSLPDRQLAGNLAGKLFTAVSYIGILSACYLLIHCLVNNGKRAIKQSFFWIVLSMLLLALVGHFGIQMILQNLKTQALPLEVMQSTFASQFKIWHAVAGMVYVAECILAIFMVIKAPK